ncbi:MAG: DJ-1/PfpI family protein [Candidatus Dormiibacterota bacterium]
MTIRPVHVYLQPTLADWEPGFAIAEINTQRFTPDAPKRYEVRTVAETAQPVRTMGGLTVVPDGVLEDLRPDASAMLMLIGSGRWDGGAGEEALAKARDFLDAGVPVAAICGATFGCARAGLLNHRRHTSAAVEYLQAAPGYTGTALYEDVPAVTDGNLITAGPAHPIDYAREVLAALEVYEPARLDAWYGLFKTGEAHYFARLHSA